MSERVHAKKSLGQNFLTDPNIQRKIVSVLDPQPTDVVLEIGPGFGAVTDHLLGRVSRLIVIELDDRLAERLRSLHAARPDFELVHDDVLRVDFSTLRLPADFKAVGNIPYNITTPLLFKLLQRSHRPRTIVVMVQKEVAIRIAAAPDRKEYGALSVGVQVVAEVERLFIVPRGAFKPVPGVDSAVMRISPHHPPLLSDAEENDVRALTRTAFSQRRKQFQKILRSAPAYGLDPKGIAALESETGLQLDARPETLSPAQFIALSRALRGIGLPMADAA
jgi:16S rRNA (adenine1518-N6/adenine1519-N6)-dimethyltransferase